MVITLPILSIFRKLFFIHITLRIAYAHPNELFVTSVPPSRRGRVVCILIHVPAPRTIINLIFLYFTDIKVDCCKSLSTGIKASLK